MIGILITNFGNVIAEFAGIAGSMELFGSPRYYLRAHLCRDRLADRRQGPVQEGGEGISRRFFFLHHLHICRSSGQAGMDGGAQSHHQASAHGALSSRLRISTWSSAWSAPPSRPGCSSICSRRSSRKESRGGSTKPRKLDVIVGCIFTDVVAWFIIVACAATLYLHGHRDIRDAADAAQALASPGGRLRLHLVFAWDSSTRRCLRLRFCRSRPPTRSVKDWASNRAWNANSPKRPSSTGSIPC